MKGRRAASLAMLAAGSALYFWAALPARRATAQAEAELERLGAEATPLRQRIAARERAQAVEESWRAAAGTAGPNPVTGLRRALLDALEGAGVTGVRLDVAPARSPLAARARLSAQGAFADVVRLAEHAVGAKTGLVPERLRFAPAGPELGLELDGGTLRARR